MNLLLFMFMNIVENIVFANYDLSVRKSGIFAFLNYKYDTVNPTERTVSLSSIDMCPVVEDSKRTIPRIQFLK